MNTQNYDLTDNPLLIGEEPQTCPSCGRVVYLIVLLQDWTVYVHKSLYYCPVSRVEKWARPDDWEEQFDDPVNDIMACCMRHVSECDCDCGRES